MKPTENIGSSIFPAVFFVIARVFRISQIRIIFVYSMQNANRTLFHIWRQNFWLILSHHMCSINFGRSFISRYFIAHSIIAVLFMNSIWIIGKKDLAIYYFLIYLLSAYWRNARLDSSHSNKYLLDTFE